MIIIVTIPIRVTVSVVPQILIVWKTVFVRDLLLLLLSLLMLILQMLALILIMLLLLLVLMIMMVILK